MDCTNEERMRELWEALGAITYAVECLDMHKEVDSYRSERLGMGAWEYARAMIDKHDPNSRSKGDDQDQIAILQRCLRHAQGVIEQLMAERAGYQSPLEQALDSSESP